MFESGVKLTFHIRKFKDAWITDMRPETGGIPVGEFRTQQLLEALHRNIDTVTVAKSAQWYRFMQTYLPKCLNQDIIEG